MEQLLKHLKNGGKAYHTPNGDFVIDVKDVKEWLKDKSIILSPIQPPIFEYTVQMRYSDGKFENTARYFTVEEFKDFGFPNSCKLNYDTKRVRQ